MSALADGSATGTACPRCGSGLAADQEWCLECGAPVRVRIRAAPDWRVPAAIVFGVIALCAVGLVIALVALSNTANRTVGAAPPAVAAPPPQTPTSAPPATTSTPAATPTASTIAKWPKGATGYTVVLGVIPGRPAAKASALKIAAAGIPVGLLRSSNFSKMAPGAWVVFSGVYTTRAQATAAATSLQAKGQTGAYAFNVIPKLAGIPAATTTTPATTTPATTTTP